MQEVQGLLFDLGGVLVALDGMPYLASLLRWETDHEALHTAWLRSPSVIAHETGQIEPAAFAAGVVADLELPTTPDDFLREFCGWLKGPLPSAVELLDEIPERYQLAALSNMSAIHWESVAESGVTRRFSQLFVSHQTGHLKPAAAAFQTALDGMGLTAADVLFIDDGVRNVDAARALGMAAEIARGPAEARAVLVQYGVLG